MDIQLLIDECAAKGGGRVTIPTGRHETGTLELRSNVELHLEAGAVLYGKPEHDAYPLPANFFYDAMKQTRGRALILADKAENIAITGSGTVDGNGQAWPDTHPRHAERPFLLRLVSCKNVRLAGITLRNPAAWTCHLQNCEDVNLQGLAIDSRVNHNNDGIDIDSCRRVSVSKCRITTGDDAICLKSTLPFPCEEIEACDCDLSSSCGAIKLGTESYGDIRKVHVHDCQVRYAGLGAIKLLTSDGGIIEDVMIENIEIQAATGPIFFRLGARGNVYAAGEAGKPAGALRRITLRNIRGNVILPDHPVRNYWNGTQEPPRALSCLFLTGLPEAAIEDVTLENIDLAFAGGGLPEDAARIPSEQPEAYPEIHHFGVLPASCIYLRHARRIALRNVCARLKSPDARPAFVKSDVQELQMEQVHLP